MVDALRSGRSGGNPVEVQVLSPAQNEPVSFGLEKQANLLCLREGLYYKSISEFIVEQALLKFQVNAGAM